MKLGGQHGTTRIYYKTLDPVYDETFTFIVDDLRHTLRIEGYDKDAVGKDDPLGTCEININNLVAFERKTEWYPLKEAKHGEIRLLTMLINVDARYVLNNKRRGETKRERGGEQREGIELETGEKEGNKRQDKRREYERE